MSLLPNNAIHLIRLQMNLFRCTESLRPGDGKR